MQNAKLRWDVITHGRGERVCVANRWTIPFIRMTDMTCRFILMTDAPTGICEISCGDGDNVKFYPYDTAFGSSFFTKKLD